MSLLRILHLIKGDSVLEWRRGYALGGILLYVFSVVYIVYRIFGQMQGPTWNALFWVIFLFVALHLVLKNFALPSRGLAKYQYTLYGPQEFLIAKCAYNTVYLCVLGLLIYGVMSLLLGHPVVDRGLFLLSIVLASVGVSIEYSFISAIAATESQSGTLMAVLALPIVIPIMLIVLKLSAQAIGLVQDTSLSTDLSILLGINLIMLAVGLILFPHIWRA